MSGCVLSKMNCATTSLAGVCLLLSLNPALLKDAEPLLRPLLNLSWGTLFGSHIWMGLVAGRILIRQVPRHQFGRIQASNFPVFFGLSTLMSALLLVSTSGLAPDRRALRMGSLLSLACSVVNGLVLSGKSTEAMEEMFAIQAKYNVGTTMKDDPKDLEEAAKDTKLQQARQRFGLYHGLVMTASLGSLTGLIPYMFA